MVGWLTLTNEQRFETLQQAALNGGMSPNAIEKDWWVTLTLRALFRGLHAHHLTFKGGTSLSKGWHLIQRFSEDIDIAVDPAAFNMEYIKEPGSAFLNRLKRRGCTFTTAELKADLDGQFTAMGIPTDRISIIAEAIHPDMPDKDPQKLLVKFDSILDPVDYLKAEVQIEASCRSLPEPFSIRPLQSLLSEHFPNPRYAETAFPVPVVDPKKTFLEKAFLLHEEYAKPDKDKIRVERMSRHFYDLVKMLHAGIHEAALDDSGLYSTIVNHRRYYSRHPYMGDYGSLSRESIAFLPPNELLEHYAADYRYMSDYMMYGDKIEFTSIISDMETILRHFRKKV
jgi:hypothetical protein